MPNQMGPMPAGLQPGANFGGTNLSLPSSGGGATTSGTSAIGGTSNPFLSAFPSGQNFPAYSSPYANAQGTSGTGTMGGFPNPFNFSSGKYPQGLDQMNVATGLKAAGYPWQIATLLSGFLSQGAGFNSDVANALVAAMQPQIQSGQANLLEQFSGMGLRGGSPAALGLAGYNAQTNLDVGELWANMYEQSIQNYLGILTGAKKQQSQGGGIMGGLSGLMGGAGGLMSGLGALGVGGGGAAAGAAGAAGSAADWASILAAGFCWVAAEVFDGWDDPRTHAVRGWLLGPFSDHWYGRLVVRLYKKFGERVAGWVRRSKLVRAVVTPLFNAALRKSGYERLRTR